MNILRISYNGEGLSCGISTRTTKLTAKQVDDAVKEFKKLLKKSR